MSLEFFEKTVRFDRDRVLKAKEEFMSPAIVDTMVRKLELNDDHVFLVVHDLVDDTYRDDEGFWWRGDLIKDVLGEEVEEELEESTSEELEMFVWVALDKGGLKPKPNPLPYLYKTPIKLHKWDTVYCPVANNRNELVGTVLADSFSINSESAGYLIKSLGLGNIIPKTISGKAVPTFKKEEF